jgi:hypothetical protein
MSLADALSEAAAVESVKATRTPAPGATTVRWDRGRTLEIDALPIGVGQAPERAALAFLEDVMGADAGLVEALDLSKLSFSLLYNDEGRQLAWIKCPVDRDKIRPTRVREASQKFVDDVSKRRPRKPRKPLTGDTTDDIWFVSDLQLGKGPEAFGGLAATLGRIGWLIDEELPHNTKRVRKIVIACAGDLTEGCQGSYTQQTHRTNLIVAEQHRAALGVLDRLVERALDLADEVEVTAVASNHDQVSRGTGKDNVTSDWDDRSFMLLDALQLAYSKNEARYGGRVTITTPADPLVAGFVVRNTTVAVTHGHKISGSGDAVSKVNKWWKAQIASRHGAAAAAHVLVAAHFHHHYLLRDGGRLLVGLPAMDGGSGYLKDGSGTWSLPGFVTMQVDDVGVRSTRLHTWPDDRVRARNDLGVVVP